MLIGAIAPPCDRAAAFVSSPSYEFPEVLRVPGRPLEWTVELAVDLDAAGRVRRITVLRSYGETSQNPGTVRTLLNAEATLEASHASYSPRIVHCKAVPSTYKYQVTFTGGP